jgi:TrmH family RNA methyltransferase
MLKITSAQNPRLKAAVRLQSARGRKQQGRFLINGIPEIVRSLKASGSLAELYLCSELVPADEFTNLIGLAESARVPIFELSAALFRGLVYGERWDGATAVAFRPDTDLDSIPLSDSMLLLVAESLEKPGNLGAVVRSADGAGAAAVIHADPSTDFFHPNAIRASLGTTLTMPVAQAPSSVVLDWLQARGFRVFATIVEASELYWNQRFAGRVAIVLGNESRGLSEVWRVPAVTAVRLPMAGQADSLNISATAAILAYEVAKQLAMQAPGSLS